MEVTAGMKELLTYIARNLVDHPDAVSVTEHKGESETVLELRVAPEDMGKVIGRQGRIAKEIRTLMRSVAQRQGTRVPGEVGAKEGGGGGAPPLFQCRARPPGRAACGRYFK